MSTVSYSKLFEPALLTTTAAAVYTVPSSSATGTIARNMLVRVSNVTTATRTVTLYAVPSGGSASTTNEFANSVSVPANDYVDFSVPTLEVSGALHGMADANSSLNIQFLSGNLFTP